MSPQNSQMIWRQAPQGGVGDAVSATTAIRVNDRLPFRERLEDRDALRAHRQAVGGVFDVAAGDDLAGVGLERGADLEAGEIRDRVLARGTRGGDEFGDRRVTSGAGVRAGQ